MKLFFLFQNTPTFFDQTVDVSTVVIALCSLFISVLAVYFTKRGLEQDREHNKKTVEPKLELICDVHQYDNPYIHFYILNKGFGTGIITELEVKFDGEKVDWTNPTGINRFIEQHIFSKQELVGETTEVIRSFQHVEVGKQAIAVGENYLLLKLEHEDISLLKRLMFNVQIDCVYKSIYEEKFNNKIDTNYEFLEGD